MDQLLAAVDLGSNSFRLHRTHRSTGRYATDPIRSIVQETVRLAAGLDAEKRLGDDAIERAIAVLERFGDRLRSFHPSPRSRGRHQYVPVARNTRDFLPRAEAALGFPSKSSPAAKRPA